MYNGKTFVDDERVPRQVGGSCRFVSSALRNVNIEHGVEFLINEILHEETRRMTGAGLSDVSGGPIVDLGAWNSYDPNAAGYCC